MSDGRPVVVADYRLDYDSSLWRPIPASFPFADWPTTESWIGELVDDFERDLGALSDEGRDALVEFARAALLDRSPEVTESLLFSPRILPVLAIGNVLIVEVDDDEEVDLHSVTSDDPRAQSAPAVEDFATEFLGTGARAAVIIESSDDRYAGGSFNYAFRRDGLVVFVSIATERVADAGLMLPFADQLVRGIRLPPR